MKQLCILIILCGAWVPARSAAEYDRFFTDKTLRFDYYHSGTKGEERFSLDAAIQEGPWPGSRINLLDTLNLGEYLVRVYDFQSTRLIYSRGFSSLFNEWQTTDEAAGGIWRTFSETVRMPYPRHTVQITISRRDSRMTFHEVFSTLLDPNDPASIIKKGREYPFRTATLMKNGPPAEKVDIVILGDGYAKNDIQKFREDAKRFNDVLFNTQPFKARAGDFNVWTVEVESKDSGIDIPDRNVWKNTALGTSYTTFGLPRYVLSSANKEIRDIAAAVPYDFICILINDTRYGGGGIFNLYSTTYTNEQVKGQEWQMDYMYVHEFGHSFAGLADEYYTSATAYNDFYPKGVEPWEPNITALSDRENIKWKDLLSPGITVPTPWEKAPFDSIAKILSGFDRLAPDYYERREPLYQAEMNILRKSRYGGVVGAFEGAGYAATGLYRPAVDCRMFSLSIVAFDPVCSAAIRRMIDFYAH